MQPCGRLGKIALDPDALKVADSKVTLRRSISQHGRAGVKLGSFGKVFGGAGAKLTAESQVAECRSIFLSCGKGIKLHRAGHILFDSVAVFIAAPKNPLGAGIVLFSGLLQPCGCLNAVLFHPDGVEIADCQITLSRGIALFSSERVKLGGAYRVRLHTTAVFIAKAETALGRWKVLRAALLQQLDGPRFILCHPAAGQQAAGVGLKRPQIALIGGLLKPAGCFCLIGFHAVAGDIADCKVILRRSVPEFCLDEKLLKVLFGFPQVFHRLFHGKKIDKHDVLRLRILLIRVFLRRMIPGIVFHSGFPLAAILKFG